MKARLSGKRDSLGKQSTDCMQMGRQLRGFFPSLLGLLFQLDCYITELGDFRGPDRSLKP